MLTTHPMTYNPRDNADVSTAADDTWDDDDGCEVDFPLWLQDAPEPEDDDQPNDDDLSQPPY